MSRNKFIFKVKSYLKTSGIRQKNLAYELLLDPADLSRRLSETEQELYPLTHLHIRAIVKALAAQGAISQRWQALDLLAEVDCPGFDEADWKITPLNKLELSSADKNLATLQPPIQPEGTITFLFTDLEDSTRLWEEYPSEMQLALARHDYILRKAIWSNGGYIFGQPGDGFCAAFGTALNALKAALAAQHDLQAEKWDAKLGGLRTRMVLYTGTANFRDNNYFGPVLSRTDRILKIAHGEQILLSRTTIELVRDLMESEIILRDLGEYYLKDLTYPERIFQLDAPGLRRNFPPLRAPQSLHSNLPAQLTSFIGRNRELEKSQRWLSKARLLTLSGIGGAGKTRLSQQLAAGLADQYPDGIWFVELAALSQEAFVTKQIASTLNVVEQSDQPLSTALINFLRPRRLLLILDNCEHLVAECARISKLLLLACPGLSILTTSRTPLGLVGETVMNVPPLVVPDPEQLKGEGSELVELIGENDAVRLFVERARNLEPSFELDQWNALDIVQIFRRLDGIPLAIELVATWVETLTVKQIAEKLNEKPYLMTNSSPKASLQQLLESSITASYNLLSKSEQNLFGQLAVFAGGWTLEATEGICQVEGNSFEQSQPTFTMLARLVNKSLVIAENFAYPRTPADYTQHSHKRYQLLQTVQEVVQNQLSQPQQLIESRNRHRDWFLQQAEKAEPLLRSARQTIWLNRLDAEHDNLREALKWSLEQKDVVKAARFGAALWRFWWYREYIQEGIHSLEQILTQEPPLPDSYELETAAKWVRLEKILTASQKLPPPLRAKLLYGLGQLNWDKQEHAIAIRLYEESLKLNRELGDNWNIAIALDSLGYTATEQGNFQLAYEYHKESYALFSELKDEWGIAQALNNLGYLASTVGNSKEARQYYVQSLTYLQEIKDARNLIMVLLRLSTINTLPEEESIAIFKSCLEHWEKVGDWVCLASSLVFIAEVTWLKGQGSQVEKNVLSASGARRVARLLGAAESVFLSVGFKSIPAEFVRVNYKQLLKSIQQCLPESELEACWEEGHKMPLAEVLSYVSQTALV